MKIKIFMIIEKTSKICMPRMTSCSFEKNRGTTVINVGSVTLSEHVIVLGSTPDLYL